MMDALRNEGITTWFDLGLMLDRLRDGRDTPGFVFDGDFKAFTRHAARGVGFVTFQFAVDGVTVEVAKYAEAMRRVLPQPRLHAIAGQFDVRAEPILGSVFERHEIPEIDGFSGWPLYRDFFHRRMERGSPLYNRLILALWDEVLMLAERLGRLIEDRDIRLLYLINTNSNPGNVTLGLALVLVSELLQIPVIANNHDYYWEGGHSRPERLKEGIGSGPRDHFFTNAHLGEVFSVIQMIYPWMARTWVTANISRHQSARLVSGFGHNPANVTELGTAVDTARFAPLNRPRRIEVMRQISLLLTGSRARLAAQSVADVLKGDPLSADRPRPMLLAARAQRSVDFLHDNVVLLQPTRIIKRKRIETNFRIIERLMTDPGFADALHKTPNLKLTLLVTGPVAGEQEAYFRRLLRDFGRFVSRVPETVRDRVFLALLFSAVDYPEFRDRFDDPCTIADLYGIASLVVLPSQTEGRGLPIFESAASGVPILTRRYDPQTVFAEAIGEHLARDERFEVIAFRNRITSRVIECVKEHVLTPLHFTSARVHNRRVAEDRCGMESLASDMERCFRQLHRQLQANDSDLLRASKALERFGKQTRRGRNELKGLLHTDNREYLPGHGRLGFMLLLKSLIDPSYFRVEEQRQRGMAFAFAQRLVDENPDPSLLSRQRYHEFLNCVDNLFLVREGEMPVMFDHALAYRHRSRADFKFYDLTWQELTGVINMLFSQIAAPPPAVGTTRQTAPHLSSWDLTLAHFCRGNLAIDDRARLWQRLTENVPIAYFPGNRLQTETELFLLQPVRARLGLETHEPLTGRDIKRGRLAPIYIFQSSKPLGENVTADTFKAYVTESRNEELNLLFRHGVCSVVPTNQLSLGIDVRQLGQRALRTLAAVRAKGGFLVSSAEQASMTTDIMNVERFHVGQATDMITANMMDLSVGDGYVQWVPAGLRATLTYPTPIQTARSFSETLNGPLFQKACKKLGERRVLGELRRDAEARGSPVVKVLERLLAPPASEGSAVFSQAINGLHADGLPWSGVLVRVPRSAGMRYRIVWSEDEPKTANEFVKSFNRSARRKARIAWNGGYILNAELVGKLGLPETYIGSPLGLLVSKGEVVCPPLFNKPALLVDKDGSLSIRRVNVRAGLRVCGAGETVDFDPGGYNAEAPGSGPCYYDLLYGSDELPGDGRTLVRLAGVRIMQVIHAGPGQVAPVLPVGLCLSFAAGTLPAEWSEGLELDIELAELTGVAQAVEAGPMLVSGGTTNIDMELEGWKTHNSIATQAARLDYLDMRGPKIAAGFDGKGELSVLTVNGRIRESVGATHPDMADILVAQGVVDAMGFDPGGSSTLVVGDEQVNISPYNRDYEQNVYALPPQPRAVANIVIGY
jgi:glycosyltransferase involved in cell wall biosynthesis